MQSITDQKELNQLTERIYKLTNILNNSLAGLGFTQLNNNYFDTLLFDVREEKIFNNIKTEAEKSCINFRYLSENKIGISTSEETNLYDVKEIISIFAKATGKEFENSTVNIKTEEKINDQFKRESKYFAE